MADSSGFVLGERVELLRRERGLSREVLAGLVGRSPEWLRQIERGIKPLDRISMIVLLARALQVEPAEFLVPGFPPLPLPSIRDENASLLRQAVLGHFGGLSMSPAMIPSSAMISHRRIAHAWDRWQMSPNRFAETLRELPPILAVAHAVDGESSDGHGAVDLSNAYRLASAYLRHTGDHSLALAAADRAVAAARHSGDPLFVAAGHGSTAESLRFLGHHTEALGISLAAVEEIVGLGAYGPQAQSVVGANLLTAALAAAGAGDQITAEGALDRAHAAARRLDSDANHFRSCFGPTDVAAHAVQVAVMLRRYRTAIRRANLVEVERLFSRERQVRHYLTLAHAHAKDGKLMGAVFLLRKAETVSPADLRYSMVFRETVSCIQHTRDPLIRRELLDIVSGARLD